MSNVTTFKGSIGVRELSTYVDPHPGLKGTDKVQVPCGRCVNKTGYIRAFAHVEGGICFECRGAGTVGINVSTVRKWAKSDAYCTEFAAEIAAHRQSLRDAEIAANAARELAQAWDDAHAEQARLASLTQGFIGQPGEKVTVEATIKVAKYIEAQQHGWSAKMFIIAETTDGNIVKISGSSNSLFELDRGDKVTLTGKVAAHENYRGQDQTVLSHVKAVVIDNED